MSTTICCPSCQRRLRSPPQSRESVTVRCPSCATVFNFSGERPQAQRETVLPETKEVEIGRHEARQAPELPESPPPSPRPRVAPQRSLSSRLQIVGAIVVVFAAFLGLSVWAALSAGNRTANDSKPTTIDTYALYMSLNI